MECILLSSVAIECMTQWSFSNGRGQASERVKLEKNIRVATWRRETYHTFIEVDAVVHMTLLVSRETKGEEHAANERQTERKHQKSNAEKGGERGLTA